MSKDFMIISQAVANLILIGIIVYQWRKVAHAQWAAKALTASSNVLLRERTDALVKLAEAQSLIAIQNLQLATMSNRRVYKWNRTKDPKQPYSMIVIADSEAAARALAREFFVSRRLSVRYLSMVPVSLDVAQREAHALFTEVPDVVLLHDMAAAAFILNLPEG